jgi:hypothetical protein
MGCSIEGVGEHDNGRGLLTGHAYGIISCRITKRDKVKLIQVFNPWGMVSAQTKKKKKQIFLFIFQFSNMLTER